MSEADDQFVSSEDDQLSDRARQTWPTGIATEYENASLDAYTDLDSLHRQRSHRKWRIATAAVFVLGFSIILGTMFAIYAQARRDESRPVDAIIILGAAQYNGRPSDVFEARLQHGLDLYNQELAPWIIVTGGRMEGDAFTEAETAETWLMNRGVPQSAILMENEGRDTWGNLQGAWDAAEPHGIHTVLIVSDGFHLFRAERLANAVGFKAYSSPAPASPITPGSKTEFSYVLRETAAVIAQMPRWLF